ncbi:hypothetical protein [Aureivirga marina]|uniref:hypothetical protein n=1 Tax=Aureivirga marina TaxID=1182451 RepID=UPI0018CB8C93|nr:hypothetical protein [Aureivirga marina]
MSIFLLLFFITAILYTFVHISLAENRWIQLVSIAIPIIFVVGIYSFSAKQNSQTVTEILNLAGVVSLVAIFQIFEVFIQIIFSLIQLKGHFLTKKKQLTNWIPVFPSFLFIIGIFFIQTLFFLEIHNINYFYLSLIFALGTGITLFLGSFLSKIMIKDWGTRAEIKILIGLFQLLLAMFLPLIVKGTKIPFTQLTIEWFPITFTFGIIGIFAVLGYFFYQKNIQINFFKKFFHK